MTNYDEDEVTSWAELADEFDDLARQAGEAAQKPLIPRFEGEVDLYQLGKREGREAAAARIRYLIPRLGDKHGPPRVGDIISGDRLDKCPLSTILRGDGAGVAAIRTVNGWSVTGMNAAQAERFVKINVWKVVEVPERGQRVS